MKKKGFMVAMVIAIIMGFIIPSFHPSFSDEKDMTVQIDKKSGRSAV